MSEHYYSEKPTVQSEEKRWSYVLLGERFQFITDRGVFSKEEVDFGSKLLIENFSEANVEGPILDVGCGYGPIGLALAKRYSKRTVWMTDINERAVGLAERNATLNHIDNVVIKQGFLLSHITESFANVVTNPPIRAGKKVVHQIFEEAYERLISGGELWVVIQKKQGAPSALEKMKSHFSEVEVVGKKKGYYIIKAKKV
ncbi:MAG TPA: class I SAM-dependent methyltransferase [Bacilli bacterium]|nr:class I SAM-dependent methyltransferase [Bacilli bacterium]